MIFHPNEAITYHEIEVCKIIMDNTFGEPVRFRNGNGNGADIFHKIKDYLKQNNIKAPNFTYKKFFIPYPEDNEDMQDEILYLISWADEDGVHMIYYTDIANGPENDLEY